MNTPSSPAHATPAIYNGILQITYQSNTAGNYTATFLVADAGMLHIYFSVPTSLVWGPNELAANAGGAIPSYHHAVPVRKSDFLSAGANFYVQFGISFSQQAPSVMVIFEDLGFTPGIVSPVPTPVPTSAITVSVEPLVLATSLSPSMAGFSYEKNKINTPIFRSSNTNLVNLFKLIGPSVFRIGGNSVEKTPWNASGLGSVAGEVAPNDIISLANFIKATDWTVIYGLSLAKSTPAAAAAEAQCAANAFGSHLLGFEIGNEPDLYYRNGLKPSTYTFSDFLSEWNACANAILATVPHAVFTGPAPSYNYKQFTIPFAAAVKQRISLLTHHYYRADGKSSTSTMDLLLSSDSGLLTELAAFSSAIKSNNIQGYRLAECNSFYNGGAPGISNGFGTALWTIDFLFKNALYGSSGVNFHGGGGGTGYTPIADNNGKVVEVRPVYYGMLLFSMAANGTMLKTAMTGNTNLFSAYASQSATGTLSVVLNNKNTTAETVSVISLNKITKSKGILLTASSLNATSGYTLGGSTIGVNGSWSPVSTVSVAVSGNTARLTVPAGSAILLTLS